MVDWASTKQRRVSYSSYGAEIIACAAADDRGFYLKMSMSSIFKGMKFRSTVVVGSKRVIRHDNHATRGPRVPPEADCAEAQRLI